MRRLLHSHRPRARVGGRGIPRGAPAGGALSIRTKALAAGSGRKASAPVGAPPVYPG
ncbi:Hypothetical protein A7982_10537 [Minicystis rosea]|nr:Hypothetical protein A7982_10537 [Minicystis rosea]